MELTILGLQKGLCTFNVKLHADMDADTDAYNDQSLFDTAWVFSILMRAHTQWNQ